MKNKYEIGMIFETRYGEKYKIFEKLANQKFKIIFLKDDFIKTIFSSTILSGRIAHPNDPTHEGFGYLGNGNYKMFINGVKTKKYDVWSAMIKRVFNKNTHAKQPSYIGTSIYKPWLNFQIFSEWFDKNWVEGFVLDKDIIVKGNKAYHPLRCCFIPHEINGLFTTAKKNRGKYPIGVTKSETSQFFRATFKVNNINIYCDRFTTPENAFIWYKYQKEKYIKEMANVWKHKLSEIAYNALMKWEIEITD